MKTGIKILGILWTAAALVACGGNTETNAESTEAPAETEAAAPVQTGSMEYAIDLEKSVVKWTATMVGLYKHTGTIKFSEGKVKIENGRITGGMLVVDMTSIAPTDQNYSDQEGGRTTDFVGHLSSEAFFDVANNPTASIEITRAGEAGLQGNFTVRGTTNEETVTNVVLDEDNGTASGKLTFNRKNYNVMWDHPVKENVISEDVELDVQLVLAQ